MKQLYPVQGRHVTRLQSILAVHGAALDNSETGCGKTVCAAEIARLHNGPAVLVVCPKAVIPAWQTELRERGVVNATVLNYERLRTGKTPFGKWQQRKVWAWTLPSGSLLIFDEVHKCAGMFTQNSKMLVAARNQRIGTLMLSATAASSPVQMRATGYSLGLHELHNFVTWCRRLGCDFNRWNKLVFTGNQGDLATLSAILSEKTSRMTVADLKDHFTETQIITDPLDFGSDIQHIYEEMEAELEALADRAKEDKKNSAAEALVAQLRARQKVELMKVPVIIDMISDYHEEGKSIAVFVNFQQTLDALREKLGGDTPMIDGRQNATEREVAIQAFQTDTARTILCNVAAGGVGVSLHDITGKHPRVAIISPSWNEKEIIQAIGRVHRAGGKTPSQQRLLFAANTVEEKVQKAVKQKIRAVEILNEKSSCEISETSYKLLPPPKFPNTQNPKTQDIMPTKDAAKPDHSKRKHATYSPSALKHFEACPSYEKREGTNAIAETGTKIHEAIDSGNLDGLSPEELEIATYCFQFHDHIQRKYLADGAKLVKTVREQVFDIHLGSETTFGSADLLEIYSDGRATLVDWKTGYNPVEDAAVNSQLWAYCVGAFAAYPEIKQIEAFLVLPRRQEISFATFDREADLPRMQLRLGTIIARAKEKKIAIPTEGTCDYCGFRGSCPALAEKALIIAKKSGFEVPENVELADASAEEKAKLYKLACLLEEWAGDTKKSLMREVLEDGLEMPGYRLDHRKTPRTIDNPVAGYKAVSDIVSLEEFLSATSRISVPALEKIVAEKADRGDKAKAKLALEDRLRDASALKEEGVIHVLKAIKS